MAFDKEGERLYVCNGSQNAVAVIEWEPEDRGETRMIGMIPVGWFPGAICFDPHRNQLAIANIKGLPLAPKKTGATEGFNLITITEVFLWCPYPPKKNWGFSRNALPEYASRLHCSGALPPRKDVAPKAIPERIGEPSLIEHVVYVIKENRTYDQVFGKLPEGRGKPELCIFGEEITPNQHKMVREFVLLDNTYCAGI